MQYLQQILLIAGIASLCGGFYFALYQLRKRLNIATTEINHLKNLMIALQSSNRFQGKKLNQVDVGHKKLLRQQKSLENTPNNQHKSYEQAAKMLSMGASPDDIMDCCQLTRGEVQLLSQLNKSTTESFVH